MMDLETFNADELFEQGVDEATALAVLTCLEETFYSKVIPVAKQLRERSFGNKVTFCSISNAKSGACAEDCKFCAQSGFYKEAKAPVFPLKSVDEIVAEATKAKDQGATEFSIVTSGTRLKTQRELKVLLEAVKRIKEQIKLEPCASLGLMKREDLLRLKEAGMMHYHHNIETSRSFFPNIVTSHSFDDEVESIRIAKDLGFKICCGGIFGMGENIEQRVEFAFNIKEINPHTIPINFLNPREGTPLFGLKELSPLDCLKIISMMRLVLPQKEIVICGGREANLGEWQNRMFDAGASGTMLGNYLTTKGQDPCKDLQMIQELGLEVSK